MLTTDVTTTLGNVSIGLSKQLKDLLTSDLTDDIVNVGGTDKRVRIASVWGDGFPNIPTSTSGDMSSTKENDYASIYLNPSDKQNYSCGIGNAYSNGLYIRSVLVYIPDTDYAGNDTDYLYSGNQNDIRIVTDVNIQNVHMYAYAHREDGGQINAEDANDIYINSLKPKLRDNETLNTVTDRGGCIYPAWLIVIDDKVAIWTGALCRAYDNYGNRNQYGNGNYSFYSFDGINKMTVTSRMFDDDNTQIYSGGVGKTIEYIYSGIENYKIKWGFYDRYPYYWTAPVDRVTKAMYMDYVSRVGLYFVVGSDENAKRYKPIITNGIVTGYTDDLSTKSDIDDWTNVNDHNIPIIPPSPGDDDDDSDDINFGYMFSGAGAFTNLWYCTQKDLADLRQWFLGADAQHPIPEGFDPMPSIIGLFQYPISLGGDVLEEIKFRTSSGLIVSTGVQAARGLSTNLKFDLGSINIPARMRERGVPFLDYESTVECYVPFCGVFQLDTQTVIGKTLSCTLWMSPATGECNCIVYTISNGIKAPVAYGSGNMSSQIPISSNGWGSYAAALKNATIQKNQIISGAAAGGVSSLLSGAGNITSTLELGEQLAGISMGKTFGSAGMVLGGAGAALGLLSTGIKAYQDINAANVGIRHLKASNGTSINGAFSGQSAWNYPMTPYVKISRPHYKKPNNYAHTQGIPLVEAKKLSECSGFTMCVGADLTGITATQTERDIISAYLTNGIIV